MKTLTTHELEKLLTTLRLFNPDIRNKIAPLVWHCRALQARIKELEHQLEDKQQPDLLSGNELGQRLFTWFNAGQNRLIENYCRVNKKSRVEALEIANKFAKGAGYKEFIE